MGVIITRNQPQGLVQINTDNPITAGLVGYILPSCANFTVTNGTLASILSRKGFAFSGSMQLTTGQSYSMANPHSLVGFFGVNTTFPGVNVLLSNTFDSEMWVGMDGSDIILSVHGTNLIVGTGVANNDYVVGAVFNGTTMSGWLNGKAVSPATITATSGTGKLVAMDYGPTVGSQWLGIGYLGLAYNRALSDAEMKSLSDNPWQVFQPPDKVILFASSVSASPAITGASSTCAVGSLVASPSFGVTGASSTSSVASLGIQEQKALSGIASTSGVGTIVSSITAPTLTGVVSTTAAGQISGPLVGASSTSGVGTLVASMVTTTQLTGAASTCAAGSVIALVNPALLLGVTITSGIGSLALQVSGIIAGTASTCAAASLVSSIGKSLVKVSSITSAEPLGFGVSVALSGIASTGVAGTLTPLAQSVTSYSLVAVSSTTAAGSLVSSISAGLAGASSALSAGALGISATTSFSLIGVASTTASSALISSLSKSLTGIASTSSVGIMTASIAPVILVGVSSTLAIASLVQTVSYALVSVFGTSGVGILSPTFTSNISLLGVASSIAVASIVFQVPRTLISVSSAAIAGLLKGAVSRLALGVVSVTNVNQLVISISYLSGAGLRLSPALSSILASKGDKLAWSNGLITALGATRTLRGFRDSNASAPDPFSTGIEFCRCSVTGTMSTLAGDVVGFGFTSNSTIQLAADLSSGASILRLEAASNSAIWVEGTLGLSGAATDWTMPSSPTTLTGIGYVLNAAIIRAPQFLPSGTGFAAPLANVNTPHHVKVQDWTGGVLADTKIIYLDSRQNDHVYDDVDMQLSTGDVGIVQTNNTVITGPVGEQFQWGATLISYNAAVNADANVPAYEVLVHPKPYGRWLGYPNNSTYVQATDVTIPHPFKILVCRADDSVLGTLDMFGFPINDAVNVQYANRDATHGYHNYWNCAMMLKWESANLKLNPKASHYYPGATDDSCRPSSAKQRVTYNWQYPPLTDNFNTNSGNHWSAMPALPGGTGAATTVRTDPYLFDISNPGSQGNFHYQATGYLAYPASISGHDPYTSPGGVRPDRHAIPVPYAYFFNNPAGVRAQENVPLVTMVREWNKAWFNHPHHYIVDAKRCQSIPTSEILSAKWAYMKAYYGYGPFVSGGEAFSVNSMTLSNAEHYSGGTAIFDRYGREPWGARTLDYLHGYGCPGYGTFLFNSVAHMISHKFRYNALIMAQLGDVAAESVTNGFYTRQYAWRLLLQVVMWKITSSHFINMSRADVEGRLVTEFETLYDTFYAPSMLQPESAILNNPSLLGFRRFGVGLGAANNGVNKWIWEVGDVQGKTFYVGAVLMIMRQTGFWDRFAGANPISQKCKTFLLWLLRCLDMYSFDYFAATRGAVAEVFNNQEISPIVPMASADPQMYANWTEYGNVQVINNSAMNGVDYVTAANGQFFDAVNGARIAYTHNRTQYMYIRRDFFGDIPSASDITGGIALIDGWFAKVRNWVNAAPDAQSKTAADFTYKFASAGQIKPPDYIGP